MNNKELSDIVETYKQLECLNPRQTKKKDNNKSDPPINREQCMSSAYSTKVSKPRKPSLPFINDSNGIKLKSNGSPKLKSRKSLFYYDRSLSTNNLLTHKVGKRDTFKDSMFIMDFADISRQHNHKINATSSESKILHSSSCINNELNAVTDDDHYLEFKKLDMYEDIIDETINIDLHHILKPKNSFDISKLKMTRQPNLSEENSSEQTTTDKESDTESPRTSDNNQFSIIKLVGPGIDSGLSSEIQINKFDSNHLQIPTSNDQITSSASNSDISDSFKTRKKITEVSQNETDSPTSPHEIDNNSISSTKSAKIQSEEEKMELFKKIAKDVSMKTFSTKEIIRFHVPSGSFSSQLIDISQTASAVCALLKYHFNINPKSHWQIVEVIHVEALERILEDHENILDVYYSWKTENLCNRFLFRENPNMYKLFLKPCEYKTEMECDIIWVKEDNSKWRKVSGFICDSTVYFKIKPDSKDHKDLYSLVNLNHFDFYVCTDNNKIKKSFKGPTNEIIVFKSSKLEHRSQNHTCICALNAQSKEKWLEALKVAKFSYERLKQNYLNFEKAHGSISSSLLRVQSSSIISANSKSLAINPSSV